MSANLIFANPESIISNQIPSANYFIQNQGQWTDEVKFLARIGGMDAWITNHGVVYDYYLVKVEEERSIKLKGHVVSSILDNSSASKSYIPQNKKKGCYNYFIGDKKNWIQNVPLYKEVVIKDIYKGIDVKYYFDEGLLRYDFIVKPGGDVSTIGFLMEGVDGLSISSIGEMEIDISLGKVVHRDILAYQEDGEVECNFIKREGNEIGFVVEDYDKTKELVIDPLIYSTFIGGSGSDNVIGVDTDADGNVVYNRTNDFSKFPNNNRSLR